jgi:magnesium transporter
MRLARAAGSPLRAAPDPPLLQRLGILLERSDSGQADPAGAAARMALFKDMVGQLHPADLQLALPDLDQPDRLDIFTRLPTELAAATLEQLDAGTQRQLVAGLGAERAADLIDFMTPGPAAAVLRNLLPSASWVILQRLGPVRARKIIALVQGRDGDGLGNLLTLRYLRAGPETGCGLLLQRYRSLAAETRAWRYIYVVAADGRLLGIGDLRDVLVAQPDVVLADIMTVNVVTLQDSDSVASAVQLFQHYGFSALPVVSMEGVLTGVLLRQDCLAVATRAHI